MSFSLGELARLVDGRVEGDESRQIEGAATLEDAGPGQISFLTHRKYRETASTSGAGALLVGEDAAGDDLLHDLVVCKDPSWALAQVLEAFHPPRQIEPVVHPSAVIAVSAVVAPSASVGPHVVVGAGSTIGAGCVLYAGVVIGADCSIGDETVLYPRVVLYDRTRLGRSVIVHAGAVIGSDGFGYATRDGETVKVPQVGCVVVEDGVEIGANTAIDRATISETRIGAGSKLDNLVQVGHNVRLGPGCVICGQAGIAGSARLGAGVVMAGQSGSNGHIEIGDGVQIAAKAAVLQSVEAGRKVAGIPAVDLRVWRRQSAFLGRIADLFRRVRRLERGEGTE